MLAGQSTLILYSMYRMEEMWQECNSELDIKEAEGCPWRFTDDDHRDVGRTPYEQSKWGH